MAESCPRRQGYIAPGFERSPLALHREVRCLRESRSDLGVPRRDSQSDRCVSVEADESVYIVLNHRFVAHDLKAWLYRDSIARVYLP